MIQQLFSAGVVMFAARAASNNLVIMTTAYVNTVVFFVDTFLILRVSPPFMPMRANKAHRVAKSGKNIIIVFTKMQQNNSQTQ